MASPLDVLRGGKCPDCGNELEPVCPFHAALAQVEAVVEAAGEVTEVAMYIGECGEHPEHLMNAEHAVQKLAAALAPFRADDGGDA